MKFFPDAEMPEDMSLELRNRSHCLRIDTFLALRKIIAEYHLDEILVRGYFCKENIHYMDSCGYDFIIMMKGMNDLVKNLVLEVKGTFEEDRNYSIRDYKVSGITVKKQLYPSDEKVMEFLTTKEGDD